MAKGTEAKILVVLLGLVGSVFAAPSADYATRNLFTDGEFFVGCNYWAKNAGMYMWRDWRPDVVEQELVALFEVR